MENPYASPSSVEAVSTATTRRRPLGVAIVSVLTGLLGLVLLAALIVMVMNWRENNEFSVNNRLAPTLFWTLPSLTMALALAASVGMWRGATWGWWIACSGLALYFLGCVVGAATVNLSHGPPSLDTLTSVDSLVQIVRGAFFGWLLAYWLSAKVRGYFRLEGTHPIKAVFIAAACGFGIIVVITVVLQVAFLSGGR